MKVVLFFTGILFLSASAWCQNTYSVSSIAAPLLSRAGAVIRNSETIIEVKALDDVYLKTKYAITILNEAAYDQAGLYLHYNKNTSVKSVSGLIYDAEGHIQARISEKNFQDRSSVSDFSLYEDDRVKFFIPAQISYPFTVEYEYEMRSRQSLYFQSWVPSVATGIAVQTAGLKFICPESFQLRHKEYNYSGEIAENSAKGIKTFAWQVSDLSALKDEPYSPNYEEYLVMVKLAPEKFAFKNIKGNFSNWKEFGIWTNEVLLKGRDEIPQTTRDYILRLVNSLEDPKEKAKKIYEFMQNKTRYISVQIGLGGYQPYPASEVDRLSYGDCKGLVNYMHALLKVANIESYYTIVNAGPFKRDISPEFTSLEGNHVILCLPFKNDTTWLECTDKMAPFGFLGDFTDDRLVLVCTPEGGKVMRTPKLASEENKQIREAQFIIDKKGSISGKMLTRFGGSQYDNHHTLLNEAYSEQKKKLSEIYPMPNLEIHDFKLIQDKGKTPETTEIISFESLNYCRINESSLHVRLNPLNKMRPLKEVSNRKNPVSVVRGYYDEDVLSYQLPEGYGPVMPAKLKNLENEFGKYSAEVNVNGNVVIYKRKMLLKEGNYKAEQYEKMVDFFQQIVEADNIEMVLKKI